MGATFDNLKILQSAEEAADGIWRQVVGWESFAKDVVGKQLARAADSIGANIAEAFGRFHYGEKLQFLYYARGSLFETKYWLNRASQRQLMEDEPVHSYTDQLTILARQLNAFVGSLRSQHKIASKRSNSTRETPVEYTPVSLFNEDDLEWLQAIPKYDFEIGQKYNV